jgi:leucyl aminopeptidase
MLVIVLICFKFPCYNASHYICINLKHQLMNIQRIKPVSKANNANTLYLVKANSDLELLGLTKHELEFVKSEKKVKNNIIEINRFKYRIFIIYISTNDSNDSKLESIRSLGNKTTKYINKAKLKEVDLSTVSGDKFDVLAFIEGMVLGNYQFLKYKTGKNKKENTFKSINIDSKVIVEDDILELQIVTDAVCFSRNFVNEPDSFMTALQLAEEARTLGSEAGAEVEVFDKRKIESLKMGGLLAVNRGSIDPPTFTIFTWKPKDAVNTKPYVFVGKGVVYDTGGLSLKPSGAMDTMKCDMAGASAVIGGLFAIAKSNLPVYVIGLIPATDNRPDGNAYTPGDVVTMYNGSTVEVLNTDAEGRMILADALSFAKKYDPELVVDIATLTGAASRAIGPQAMVGMKVKADAEFKLLSRSGNSVHERIVEFPMWDEYGEQIKSEIADIKNIGGVDAGAITAAKFLEHFVDYPYIHLDIAGPSFLSKANSYRPTGGTGIGVRLFYDFIKSKAK